MAIDPSQFYKLNVVDTCAVWNILSSQLLYSTALTAGCSFCFTDFVYYECLHKPRSNAKAHDLKLQNRLREEIQAGRFKNYSLDLEDLQDIEILQKRKNLGKGELSSIAYANKTKQAFLTDDMKARKLAGEANCQFVQTTPHLLGWLYFANFLGDCDLQPIIKEHENHVDRGSLARYFTEMYNMALDYRLKMSTRVDVN